nr:HAMP domain-containing protein [Ardenticatenales bacterium]
GQGNRRTPPIVLADAEGRVIHDTRGRPPGSLVSDRMLQDGVPLDQGGARIGYLVLQVPNRTELAPFAQGFLSQINRTLLQAGLFVGGLGVGLGLLIARRLMAPLQRLVDVTQHIAEGRFEQRVTEEGTEEIAELARSLNEMAAALQQSETLRRNLVADIAHDLRTPLSVLQGNLQALLDDVYPLEKAEIANLYDETRMLSRLVNDLREMGLAEAGQLSLHPEPLEIGGLLQDITSLYVEVAAEQNITVALDAPTDLPLTLADPERTRQVLHNLLSNALRHTSPQGTITLRAASAPAAVRVSVQDSGPGIPAADLPRLFERFWRADKSRSREYGGSGLGLAIVKHLVELQGGEIGVESREGVGSCFWFTLPLA